MSSMSSRRSAEQLRAGWRSAHVEVPAALAAPPIAANHRVAPDLTEPPMPLPKPPAKRADFLSRGDLESPAVHRSGKHGGGAQPAAEPVAPAVLELSNEGALPAAAPVAVKA